MECSNPQEIRMSHMINNSNEKQSQLTGIKFPEKLKWTNKNSKKKGKKEEGRRERER